MSGLGLVTVWRKAPSFFFLSQMRTFGGPLRRVKKRKTGDQEERKTSSMSGMDKIRICKACVRSPHGRRKVEE